MKRLAAAAVALTAVLAITGCSSGTDLSVPYNKRIYSEKQLDLIAASVQKQLHLTGDQETSSEFNDDRGTADVLGPGITVTPKSCANYFAARELKLNDPTVTQLIYAAIDSHPTFAIGTAPNTAKPVTSVISDEKKLVAACGSAIFHGSQGSSPVSYTTTNVATNADNSIAVTETIYDDNDEVVGTNVTLEALSGNIVIEVDRDGSTSTAGFAAIVNAAIAGAKKTGH